MTLTEAALWALRQNYHLDRANAAVHCAPVRFSPLTFALYESLADTEDVSNADLYMFQHLERDHGAYALDPGR